MATDESEEIAGRRIDFWARPKDMVAINEMMDLLGGSDMTTAIRAALGLVRHVKLSLDRTSLTNAD